MRRCAGRGELGEFGANRKCRLRFADCRAEEERMLARCSVAASELELRSISGVPLDGDISFLVSFPKSQLKPRSRLKIGDEMSWKETML